jgi:ATP-dependent Zn protease
MTKKRVLSIAYHEAGHAVAARLVKPPVMVKYVTIITDEHNLGHCKGGVVCRFCRPARFK